MESSVLKLDVNTAPRRFPTISRSCVTLTAFPTPILIICTPTRRKMAEGIATLSKDFPCVITKRTLFRLLDRFLNNALLTYLRAAPVRGPPLKNGALLMALNKLLRLPL